MKEGWTYKKLGEVCESLNGLWKGKKPPYMNVGVIRNANFTKDFTLNFDNIEYLDVEEKQYSKRKLQAGDIIVEKSGGSDKQPVGRAVLFDKSEGEYSFSNFTSVLRIKDQNEIYSAFLYKYLLYVYLGGATKKMQKATTGIHNLEFQQYLNIDVPCIEMGVQQRIVERLDSAFENIDKLKANAEKQLAEARILFQKSLAKAMEPKEGWEEKKLGDVAEVNRGRSKHRPRNDKRLFGGPYPFIQTGDIRNAQGGEIKDFSQTYSEFGLSQSKLWAKGTICITIAANIGETAILGFDACFPDSIVGIHPDETVLDALFLNYYLLSIKKEIDSQSYGTAQKNINLEVLNNIVMQIPPLPVQQRIVERLDSLSENVRKYEKIQRQIISECDALKQALLRKVFE